MTSRPDAEALLAGHRLVFVGGLHRSGTSFIARMLAGHPDASGLTGTGAYEDEGQHLQDVYPAANKYGGPGHFALAPEMHLVESDAGSPPDREAKALRLLSGWVPHWDMDKQILVEKSPPNLVKARYLQSLFPGAAFLMVTRHPIAVSEATAHWSKTDRYQLTRHWLHAHEIMRDDTCKLDCAVTVRYEDVVAAPQHEYAKVLEWLGLLSHDTGEPVRAGVNEKYFASWQAGGPWKRRAARRATAEYAERVASFGYSLHPPYSQLVDGSHRRSGAQPA
ncbi:MAG: sulfotransferase family protein [Acidimicrobiales bacterium]